MIRNLIWDVDGTLFDTYPAFTNAMMAACADLGRSFPADWILSLTRKEISHCATVLAGEFGIAPEQVMEQFRLRYKAILPEQQAPFPGVIQICEHILAIGGTNVIITHRRRETTDQLLRAHNMAHYFTDAFTSDDGYPRKPDPAAFDAMIQKHGFKREETMGVGDRDIDVLAAQRAGIPACLYGGERYDGLAPELDLTDYAHLLEFIKDGSRIPKVG